MTNITTPPNTRSNNVVGNQQPLPTQQPTTTDKIKDSVKQAVNMAQNVLSGSTTNTRTPPSSNDSAHVVGGNDSRRPLEKTDIGTAYNTSRNVAENKAANTFGVRETEPLKRNEDVVNKVASLTSNVVGKVEGTAERVTGIHNDVGRSDKHGACGLSNDVGNADKRGLRNDVRNADMCGLSNDVGCTDKHGAKNTGYPQTVPPPKQQANLVPPPPQQQVGGKLTGNIALDSTERPVNVAGNVSDKTRPGNQAQLGNNLSGRQDTTVLPNKVSAVNKSDDTRRF
ncbi:hypothetical protein H4S07_002396 [Coemansia furcata]|uniref:Uncharacterized protein n=1 Tax=Coemansia furcata TaxID=417177 RepID=A0ACC1LJQ9_9FUNG|nr:hypothetical protein H4S07_002396 [Coemansia furcata]